MAVVIFSRKNARSKTPFLKLESFGYNNNNGDLVNQQCLRNVSDLNYYCS